MGEAMTVSYVLYLIGFVLVTVAKAMTMVVVALGLSSAAMSLFAGAWRRVAAWVAVVALLVGAAAWTPVSAQIPVEDFANNLILGTISSSHAEELQRLIAITKTVTELATKLEGMDRFRTPPIAGSTPDATNLPWAKPIIDALTLGDPRDERYRSFVTPLPPLQPILDRLNLPAGTQRIIEAAYGGLQVFDTTAPRALHQSSLQRGFTALDLALKALDDDVGSGDNKTHYLTAELGKVAGGMLMLNRQATTDAQATAGQLEQMVAQNIAQRNDQAQALNFTLDMAQAQAQAATAADWAGSALEHWSLR